LSDFDKALDFVLRWEGGKVDDPHDRGGRTNRGITQLTYNAWRQANNLPIDDVWESTLAEAADIYQKRFWGPSGADKEAWPLNLALMDFAVHSGPTRAKQKLQEIRTGGVTGLTVQETAEALVAKRRLFLQRIVKGNPSQQKFLKGWMNRVDALEEAVRA
jgi:lysozyme family protein